MSISPIFLLISTIFINVNAITVTLDLSESGPDYLEKFQVSLTEFIEQHDLNDKTTYNLTYKLYLPKRTPLDVVHNVLEIFEDTLSAKITGFDVSARYVPDAGFIEIDELSIYIFVDKDAETTESYSTTSGIEDTSSSDESSTALSSSSTGTDEPQSTLGDSTNFTPGTAEQDPSTFSENTESYSTVSTEAPSYVETETTTEGIETLPSEETEGTTEPEIQTTEGKEIFPTIPGDSTNSTPEPESTGTTSGYYGTSTETPPISDEICIDECTAIKEKIIDVITNLIKDGGFDCNDAPTFRLKFSTNKKYSNPKFNQNKIKKLKKFLVELEPEASVKHLRTNNENGKTIFILEITLPSLKNSTIFNLPKKFPLVSKHRVSLIDGKNFEKKVEQILYYKMYSTRRAEKDESMILTLLFMVKKNGDESYYKKLKQAVFSELTKYDQISFQSSRFEDNYENTGEKFLIVNVLKWK